jgi:hypothetical protein
VAPFGEYTAAANANVLLWQKIGNIETKYPLLAFGEDKGAKIAVLCAEGIWKWRVADFQDHESFDMTDELINKTIQLLSLKEDKRKFRVFAANTIFNENEAVVLDAELYNDSYELVNSPEATILITNEQGKNFNFSFTKTANAYTLNANYLPIGNYKYEASTNYLGKTLKANGQFSVQPIQLEAYETTANHQILNILSEKFGGQTVYPTELNSLAKIIKDKGAVKSLLYDTFQTRSLINLKWIFFLLLGLLSLEWFARRYFGSY